MARDWSELLLLREPATVPAEVELERTAGRGRFRRRLRESLRATRETLAAPVLRRRLAAHDWESIEESLILADLGVATTTEVVASLERAVRTERLDDEALPERLAALLAALGRPGSQAAARIDLRAEPAIILIVGVNGAGKTTTLGKLAWQLREHFGLRVLLGAGDTYRAAATEQLEAWAARAGCEIVTGPAGSDPGAVAYETLARARAESFDVALVDTAGRLHNQEPLMAELEKVRRVIARQVEGAPHETLLVIDATSGQNGLRQAEQFARAVAVDGIVLTKLDGTAKGGIAIAIARELGIAVKLIGIGEQLEDLRPFDADEFARTLVGLE